MSLIRYSLIILHVVPLIWACTPFSTTFPSGSVTILSGKPGPDSMAPFISVSPSSSFSTGHDGLTMFLRKPPGIITKEGGVNSRLAEGATINSTFSLLHGKVTFEVSAPSVPGVVTAVIVIGADHPDEIDVELLGGDANHWQSNVFAPSVSDKGPLWGVLGQRHKLQSHTIASTHAYTIDWNAERIIWSVDGTAIRTLQPNQTRINGAIHYPTHAARVQLGIWDASSPLGTAQWAKGPIDWQKAPGQIQAVVKSLKVECPNP